MENNFEYANETETNVENTNVEGQTTDETPVETSETPDLTQYERFKLGEKEVTREELEKGFMLHSDYTKKTQSLAEEKKFYTNLQADLDSVARNPALASKFREVYPKSFHSYLNYVSRETMQTSNKGNQSQTQNALDPKIQEALSKVENFEKRFHQESVKAAETEIDSIITKLSPKYPFAIPNGNDEHFILTKAQHAQSQKAPGEKLSTDEWEKIFKEANAHYKKFSDGRITQMNTNQKVAHVRGKEIGGGGGVPGGAPKMPRTIREATRIAEEDLGRPR